MVRLDVVRSANSNFIKSQTQPLVAVFVGGTSGIGEYTLRQLVTTHGNEGKGLRIYIVGRNANAAEKIISDCQKICQTGQFRFVKASDLALLRDVDRVCKEIFELEKGEEGKGGNSGKARIDLLVQSQAYLAWEGRKETKEGLDTQMALLYYSRMRFIHNLLPLLLASQVPAHAISIYAAGAESKFFPEDLSLRDLKHYGFANCRSHCVHMKTFFMEAIAEKYPGKVSLSHIFPSLVITNGFDNEFLPTWFKVVWKYMAGPVMKYVAVPAVESGQRTLFLSTSRFPAKGGAVGGNVKEDEITIGSNGNRGSGAYNMNWNGEPILNAKKYTKLREEGLGKKIWDHTNRAFEDIEKTGTFSG